MASLGVALVTGAGGGIGRAIALRLARDGFDIALNDIHANLPKVEAVGQEVSKFGRKTSVLTANVAHEKEVSKMVDHAVRDLGGLDVVCKHCLASHHVDWCCATFIDGRQCRHSEGGLYFGWCVSSRSWIEYRCSMTFDSLK